ncbi:MAG: hypothetical protein JNJ94_14205 [Chlorobi bacterium]|nr:hypothetical protein [Chlorobiota bacterium]
MNQEAETEHGRGKRWLLVVVAFMVVWSQDAMGQLREGDIRSVGNGTWEESGIWERWNGAAWIPLLPGEYPGSQSLPESRVVIQHQVLIPLGEAIYVASVQAEQGKNLQVEGELVIGKQQAQSNTAAITKKQGGFAIAGVYPNPLIGQQGGRAWIRLHLNQGQQHQQVRLWIADESGQVVRALPPLREVAAGEHDVAVEFGDLPSGNYLLVAECNGERCARQVVVAQ